LVRSELARTKGNEKIFTPQVLVAELQHYSTPRNESKKSKVGADQELPGFHVNKEPDIDDRTNYS
jgi:rRNA-processing protein FCF1